MSNTGSAVDAFGAYTEEAAYYDLPCDDLDSILPAFARGLLGAAGGMLAVLGYRDARAFGDGPVDRAAPGVRETVLFRLPESCDMRDAAFRAGVARAFHDLGLQYRVVQGRAGAGLAEGEREHHRRGDGGPGDAQRGAVRAEAGHQHPGGLHQQVGGQQREPRTEIAVVAGQSLIAVSGKSGKLLDVG
ncbi:hypothetical protein [Streptomyces sp. NPDC001450]